MSFSMTTIAPELRLDDQGIWHSSHQSEISYPVQANDLFFDIEEHSYWFQHRNKIIIELLKRYPPPGVMFDIGGGNGFVAKGIQQAGYDVVLVEPGPQGALNAKRRGLEHVICSTFENAGFLKNSISAAGFFDVLEHIQDDVGLLSQLHAFMPAGGRVYLTVPAHRWLWSNEDVAAGHFRRHTIASVNKLLGQTGFEMEYASYLFRHLVTPIFLLRSLPSAIGWRKSTSNAVTRNEHQAPQGLLGRLFSRWEAKEVERTRKGKANTWWGSSCLVVARKS